jgi:repressor of nif and glnA expression
LACKNADLAKRLKRVKVYSQLKFLEKYGYICKKDYPNKNYITMKGLKELQRGQGYV